MSKLIKVTNVTTGIEAVRAKLAELQLIQSSAWKTSGKITMGNGSIKDLKEETDITELVKAFSTISLRLKALDAAYDALKFNPAPVSKIDGGTYEEFLHDFELRIKIIQQKETFDKLTKIEAQFRELMGKEEKMELLIKEIENL